MAGSEKWRAHLDLVYQSYPVMISAQCIRILMSALRCRAACLKSDGVAGWRLSLSVCMANPFIILPTTLFSSFHRTQQCHHFVAVPASLHVTRQVVTAGLGRV